MKKGEAELSTAIFVAGIVGEALIGWVESGWVKGGIFVTQTTSLKRHHQVISAQNKDPSLHLF